MEPLFVRRHHFLHEVDDAVPCGFRADERSTPGEAFTSENSGLMTARNASILTEKVADFAPTDADVTCGNVDILADMALELQHERLAESHHFMFGLTFRIKVRTAFTATDG